ncbi:hypothetical protein G5I_03195 [Acromyrmex echinatior]|uniref:Uncharacterized protein n=1 Tax=Acromyrmex echinatior TaxID=103372 RepID=F4WCC1_ACREC|nr:hypothetical protein G5I_03195 [Acromyrmex echinatior]
MVVIFRELASAEACMLANAAEFRLASMGCWSAAVTTEVLLPATRLAWYTVAVGASSEPPVASSWAPIGADGPWSPSDEATLTASSFSGGRKTALPRLPPPPPPPPPPLPVTLGEHVLGGGSVGTVSHQQSTAQCVACHASPAMSLAGPTLFRGSAHSIFRSFPLESFQQGHGTPRQDYPQTHQDYVVSHRQSVDIQCYALLRRPHASRSLLAAASHGTHHGTDQCFSLASTGAQSATLTHFRCTIDYTKKNNHDDVNGVSSSHMRKITSRFGTLW